MSVSSRIIQFLILLLPVPALAGSIEGRLAYRKGDYASALNEFGQGEHGGPIGTFFLALMYMRGEGVPKDEVRGMKLLRLSADEGYSAAQYLLGKQYYYGHGISKNKVLAKVYISKASADYDYRALTFMKIMREGSHGEKKDSERIVRTVKRNARLKVSDAQYSLAFMYLIGDGVPKDGIEEVRWYHAAAATNVRASFMLSLMYQSGDGVPCNLQESFRLMQIAADLGDIRAQYYLGTFYYQGIGTQVDRQSAAVWVRKSAENGLADAQLAFGLLLLSGDGVPVDRCKAVEWLGKAAKQDNVRAKELLHELLSYRGQLAPSSITDVSSSGAKKEKYQNENQLRLEGKGLILDQGTFGLKFSLPTLYDAYAPQNQTAVRPLWEQFQGGTFDIIFRPLK